LAGKEEMGPERSRVGGQDVQKSKGLSMISGVVSSGISTLVKAKSNFPSRAMRALLRMESFSPKGMFPSEEETGRSGKETPIISADS
jgi:hypothetical protein